MEFRLTVLDHEIGFIWASYGHILIEKLTASSFQCNHTSDHHLSLGVLLECIMQPLWPGPWPKIGSFSVTRSLFKAVVRLSQGETIFGVFIFFGCQWIPITFLAWKLGESYTELCVHYGTIIQIPFPGELEF